MIALGNALLLAAACGRVGYQPLGRQANAGEDAAISPDAPAPPDTRDAFSGPMDLRDAPSLGIDAALDVVAPDGQPEPRADGGSPDVQGPPPVLGPVTTLASDVFELNGASLVSGRVYLTYDASLRLQLVELDGTGRPVGAAQNLGDQTVLDQGVVMPLADRMLLVFSNHSFSSEWFLYGVTFAPRGAPDVAQRFPIGPRVLEARSPTLLAVGSNVVVSWRYGGSSIGYARIAPPGTVSAANALQNNLTNAAPKRLFARGSGVVALAATAGSVPGYVLEQVDGLGTRTANALEGMATTADLALGTTAHLVYARDRTVYSQPLTTSLAARDPAVAVHTAATAVSLVHANAVGTGLLLAWVTSSGLQASYLDATGRLSSPVQVSTVGADIPRVRSVDAPNGVLVIWHESTPSNVLKAAAITAP